MKPSDYIKKGWCQGVSAKDESGHLCKAQDPHAVAWCLYGAINVAYPYDCDKRGQVIERLMTSLYNKVKTYYIVAWNDNPDRTQQQVLELLESIGE